MFAVGYGADATRKSNLQCHDSLLTSSDQCDADFVAGTLPFEFIERFRILNHYYSLKISTTLRDVDFEKTGCMT